MRINNFARQNFFLFEHQELQYLLSPLSINIYEKKRNLKENENILWII